jgi:chromosome segregation ATPase
MEQNAELLRLEELVDQVLTKYNQLKSDYHALEEMLQQRDAECAELKEKILDLTDERTAVSGRVSGLLDRISQWESEQAGNAGGNMETSSGAQGSLFDGDSEDQ